MINKSMRIPLLQTTIFHGEKMYYRFVTNKDFMRKYKGFGESVSVLKLLNRKRRILFFYRGESVNRLFIAEVEQFFNSDKTWLNDGKDLQKFVSIADMEEMMV